jgi:hypothetical protein
MDISLVTIAFNGYGRFLGQFLAFASNLSPRPKEVVVVLGRDHGCMDIGLLECIYPGVKVVHYKKKPTFGKLRNIAISKTKSEWTWFVSVDDKPMPDAIRTFKRAVAESTEADYLCAQWYTIGLGEPLRRHRSPTPQESAERLSNGQRMGFIIAHSPFKRALWEKSPYKNSDLPNYDFVANCVVNGAVFAKAGKPTTTYLRRDASHARTTLLTGNVREKARAEKRRMEQTILRHYSKQ